MPIACGGTRAISGRSPKGSGGHSSVGTARDSGHWPLGYLQPVSLPMPWTVLPVKAGLVPAPSQHQQSRRRSIMRLCRAETFPSVYIADEIAGPLGEAIHVRPLWLFADGVQHVTRVHNFLDGWNGHACYSLHTIRFYLASSTIAIARDRTRNKPSVAGINPASSSLNERYGRWTEQGVRS